tara:strand:- start:53 stop:694 length:642 start_codon:yes stop_codon:yes gene_type:complete
MSKHCKKCDTTKELSSFSRDKRRKDGLQPYCKDCCKASTKLRRDTNTEYRERVYAQAKVWAKENAEKVAARKKELYQENLEQNQAKAKEYYKANREYILEYKSEWAKENRDKRNAIESRRYAAKMKRTPTWLSEQQQQDIQAMYTLAKKLENLCGIQYDVDHIVPMQGKNVSGLHVPWNLQILPRVLNQKKGNSFADETPTNTYRTDLKRLTP